MRAAKPPRNYRQATLAAALLVLASTAQGTEKDEGPRTGWRPFVVGGLTFGGESLFTMSFVSGAEVKIRSGGFLQLGIGAHWRAEEAPLSVALSANWHNENTPAVDGYSDFTRYPLEAILYYHAAENWRFGLGARRVLSPILDIKKTSDPAFNFVQTYYDATGAIGEIGYSATQNLWINLRYVREEYKPKRFSDINAGVAFDVSAEPAIDGSHFGINLIYVF